MSGTLPTAMRALRISTPRTTVPRTLQFLTRSLATEAPSPKITTDTTSLPNAPLTSPHPTPSEWLPPHRPGTPFNLTIHSSPPLRRPPPPEESVLTTIYSFPHLEPLSFTTFPHSHLYLPLRRDLMHRAVIHDEDAAHPVTAYTLHRTEIAGSRRKLRPQKGTGKARLGDRGSPMLRGGGVAHGPKPRDMSTRLPQKVYDIAMRTALSYRYRRGELIVLENGFEIEESDERWIAKVMKWHGLGKGFKRSSFITREAKPVFDSSMKSQVQGVVKLEKEVKIKDLLMGGALLMEEDALRRILGRHSSDLMRVVPSAVYD